MTVETNAKASKFVIKRLAFFSANGDLTFEQINEKFEKVRYSISATEREHYVALLTSFKKIQTMFGASESDMRGKTLNTLFC